MSKFPVAKNADLISEYPALVGSGGGYVWDDVLEYRVWCSPRNGAPDEEGGDDYYYAFATYEEAEDFASQQPGAEKPLALIVQEEYISEPESGNYIHVKEQRITEWDVDFLSRPKRTANTIPDFFSPDAPANRLDILRGKA